MIEYTNEQQKELKKIESKKMKKEFIKVAKVMIKNLNREMGQDFNGWWEQLKDYSLGKYKTEGIITPSVNLLQKINRKEIIIFSAGNKLEQTKVSNSDRKKLVVFPFDKIFLDYNFGIEMDDDFYAVCNGIFFQKEKEVIMVCMLWSYFNVITGEQKQKAINFGFKEEFMLQTENIQLDKLKTPFGERQTKRILNIIEKFVVAVGKKEYTTYKKWKPSGLVTKEIIYANDVSAHIRHFWPDSGRFKISYMSKEELIEKGYHIHEIVYRDGELRRDVPYTIIGAFVTGADKPKKEKNTTREIMKGRIFRQEQKLYEIIRDIFPKEFIKQHDRKAVKPLELDIYIRNLKLAFEYDGEQHFIREVCENVFHSDFDELQKRDRKKDIMCRDKGICLIRVKYDEKLSGRLVKAKLRKAGTNYGKQ